MLDFDPSDLRAEGAPVNGKAAIVERQKVHFVRHAGLGMSLVQECCVIGGDEAIAGA